MVDLKNIHGELEKTYSLLNRFISVGHLPLIDLVYPKHDGVQNADVVSDLFLLRDTLYNIVIACNSAIDDITVVIDS